MDRWTSEPDLTEGRLRPHRPGIGQSLSRTSFMRLVDVAAYLGVTKQRAHQLAGEDGFPASAMIARGSRVWESAGGRVGRAQVVGDAAVAQRSTVTDAGSLEAYSC